MKSASFHRKNFTLEMAGSRAIIGQERTLNISFFNHENPPQLLRPLLFHNTLKEYKQKFQ
jgi:hypothetical protein